MNKMADLKDAFEKISISDSSHSAPGLVDGDKQRLANQNGGLIGKLMEEILECPVCFEPFKKEIMLCVGGHSICNSCCMQLKDQRCPTCAQSLSTARNWQLENLIEKLDKVQPKLIESDKKLFDAKKLSVCLNLKYNAIREQMSHVETENYQIKKVLDNLNEELSENKKKLVDFYENEKYKAENRICTETQTDVRNVICIETQTDVKDFISTETQTDVWNFNPIEIPTENEMKHSIETQTVIEVKSVKIQTLGEKGVMIRQSTRLRKKREYAS